MGNFNSSTNSSSSNSNDEYEKNLSDLYNDNDKINKLLVNNLDKIVSNFIHTMNPSDLKKFSDGDENYCKDIVILTSEILNKNYTKYELKVIDNKISSNDKSSKVTNVYFKHNYHSDNNDETKELCLKIGLYYVRIAIIFSTIVNILNPLIDKYNNGTLVNIFDNNIQGNDRLKSEKKESFKDKDIYYSGLCDTRYNYLFNSVDFSEDPIKINKDKLCGLFFSKKLDIDTIQQVNNIYAIQQLYYNNPNFYSLFYDDKKEYYNFFDNITEITLPSSKTRQEVKKNIEKLKKDYRENKSINSDLKYDSQRDPNQKLSNNINIDNLCDKIINYNYKEILISKDKNVNVYINHLKDMIIKIKDYKKELIKIINEELFEIISDNKTSRSNLDKEKNINYNFRVNSNLSIEKLNNLTDYVRKLVIDMYLNCENDYITGINYLEEIIKNDIKNNADKYNNKNKVDIKYYNSIKKELLSSINSQGDNRFSYYPNNDNEYNFWRDLQREQ